MYLLSQLIEELTKTLEATGDVPVEIKWTGCVSDRCSDDVQNVECVYIAAMNGGKQHVRICARY